ncbi:MAG: hypothetical protein ACOYKC_07520 [Anaerolineaceae bacterium]|jgi:hypothetical protein
MTESQNLNPNPDETPVLRCNRCDQPITPETAVLTPTGYRCQSCVKEQQKVFDNTRFFDLVLGFIIAAVLSYAGGWLVSRLGFFTLLVAPSVGVLIFRAVRLAVNKRRSRALNNAILVGAIIGCIPMLVPEITALILSGGDALSFTGSLLPLIWRVVYTVLVASTAYAQSKGLRL